PPARVAALRAHLARTLPEYMVPTAWVELPALPLTPSGKVDRRRLIGLAPSPAAAAAGSAGAAGRAGEAGRRPSGPAEELLAAIWEEVLGVPEVGPDDSFFGLGGHSLLAIQVVARVRRAWGVELPVRALFELPTVARLATHLATLAAGGEAAAAPPLVPVPRHSTVVGGAAAAARLPLSFGQQRLWFLDRLERAGSAAYNMPAAVRLRGELDPAALAAALGEVVRRHEVLRTVFTLDGGEPVQVPLPAAPLPLPLVDLAAVAAGRRTAVARRLFAAAAALPFDLAAGPVVRALLLRAAPREHLLLVVVHHVASDAWSLGLLVREPAALYAAAHEGKPSPLAELPLQYADYAAWQRGWLRGEALAAQLAWWRQALAGAPPLLDLPTDRPRPARQTFRGARAVRRLPPEAGPRLAAVARAQGATPFMVHLAAFQALLGRYAGQRVVVVGTPIANRRFAELEELIGFFVNTLALAGEVRGETGEEPTFAAHLARVRETALGAYAHQDLPFEKLVEELRPERSLALSPLFQVLFTLDNPPPPPPLAGLAPEPIAVESGAAKFDLTLGLEAAAGGAIAGGLEYNTDLFDAPTAARLAGHFAGLLAAFIAQPERPAAELPLLAPAELHQVLREWNDTRPPAAAAAALALPLHRLFERQAAATPGAVAVTGGGDSLTYRDLDRHAAELARRLAALGIG
ncbi:MAG: non-ribosomal peptide synthetase, partial [Acidobacteria bacterium]|nr:non-ribosomal peptide synthetase [Acidobacteriota bacterium]